jgi:hypothetical protein
MYRRCATSATFSARVGTLTAAERAAGISIAAMPAVVLAPTCRGSCRGSTVWDTKLITTERLSRVATFVGIAAKRMMLSGYP